MRFSGWPSGPIDYSNGDPPSVTPPLPPTADCYAGLASPLASVDPSPVIPGPGATLCPRPGPQPCVSGPGDTPSPQTWLLSPPLPDPIPVSFSSTALPDTQPAYCAPICCLQPKCCLQGRWGICAFCPPRHALCIQRVSTDICEQRH